MYRRDPIIMVANLVSIAFLLFAAIPLVDHLRVPTRPGATIPMAAPYLRWKQCSTVSVYLDSRDASLENSVLEAVGYLRYQTGLELVFKGTTRTPQIKGWLKHRPGAIVISSRFPVFPDNSRPLGLAYRGVSEANEITSVAIALNAPAMGGSDTTLQTIYHELGHAIGLEHSGKFGDLMYPYLHRTSDADLPSEVIAQLRDLYRCPK